MRRALLMLLLCGCELPSRDVLTTNPVKPPPGPFIDCASAIAKGQVGDSCIGLPELCVEDTSACCKTMLACDKLTITSITRDCSTCASCAADKECSGTDYCVNKVCEPCEARVCPACPSPFVRVLRNGCDTCDCAPPPCGTCAGTQKCAQGAYCQPACDGPECCASFCAEGGCASPDPEGCSTDCGAQSCALCRASACQCLGGKWSCSAVCAEDLKPYVTRCMF
jgi:hypothetical protein